jgi:translation initiation factor IF-3
MFRGREVTHPERGRMILDRLAEELQELAIIEQRPNLDGRNMTMMLGPSKAVLAGTVDNESASAASEDAENEVAEVAEVATDATVAEAPVVDEPVVDEPDDDDAAEDDAAEEAEEAVAETAAEPDGDTTESS